MQTIERTTVRIDRSPPRRVLMPTRWRSFKTGPDRMIWADAWAPVLWLLDEGYRLTRVAIDWGASAPNTKAWREQAIRDLCGCYDGCEVAETISGLGRGSMTIEMIRD